MTMMTGYDDAQDNAHFLYSVNLRRILACIVYELQAAATALREELAAVKSELAVLKESADLLRRQKAEVERARFDTKSISSALVLVSYIEWHRYAFLADHLALDTVQYKRSSCSSRRFRNMDALLSNSHLDTRIKMYPNKYGNVKLVRQLETVQMPAAKNVLGCSSMTRNAYSSERRTGNAPT